MMAANGMGGFNPMMGKPLSNEHFAYTGLTS